MPIVAPSLLAADFLHLDRECEMLNRSEADWFHLDIMDGSFVPNISFGFPVVNAIRAATKKFCDVHLMIDNPENYTERFREAGADLLTVHIEACPHLHRNIQMIKDAGMKVGVALNPHTKVESLYDILGEIDLVNMMTVNPGFGGQSFIDFTLNKISTLRQRIDEQRLNVLIEVDGGVTLENASTIVNAGAHVLVAGNTVFKAKDPLAAISFLKNL